MKLASTILSLTLIIAATRSFAQQQPAVWQWSVPDGSARAYLWIPPACQRVRAVVVANHNMIEQGILEHPTMRLTLGELGIAEVWVVPAMDGMFDFNKGAGEHFQRIMTALADVSGYDELASAPVVPLGHSACASYPWNFAAWDKRRTLAVLSVHGDAPRTNRTGSGKPNVDWGDHDIDGVPCLMVMGEYEWFEDRLDPAIAFMAEHPAAPIALLADAGHGHFDYSEDLVSFLAMFIRKAADQRLPVPDGGALRSIDPKTGWCVDRWRHDQRLIAPAAPFNEYTGDKAHAFWCFDQQMAVATEAYYTRARGKKPQLIGFLQDGLAAGQKESLSQVDLKWQPLEDGVTFKVHADFLDRVPPGSKNVEKWTGLPAGSPLGHASGDGPIVVSRIVGPFVKIDDDTFRLQLGRAEYTANSRNRDCWILAAHPGDEFYKSAVQQSCLHVGENKVGAAQTISFDAIAPPAAGADTVPLHATSSAGLPVSFYVREGPAEVVGDRLRLLPVPPRSKYPVAITVVAWQWGKAGLQAAMPVEQTLRMQK